MFALTPGAIVAAPVTPQINNPRIAYLGDSITQFASPAFNVLTGTVYTRDSSGLVTVTNCPYTSTDLYVGRRGYVVCGSDSFSGEVVITSLLTSSSFTMTYNVPILTALTLTAGDGGGRLTDWATSKSQGTMQYVHSVFGGGLIFNGNYGVEGLPASNTGVHLARALAKVPKPDIVILEIGVNDLNFQFSSNAFTPIVLYNNIIALVNQAIAAGSKVCVISIEPTASSANSAGRMAAAETVNSMLALYFAVNPASGVFANTYSVMYDPASSTHSVKAGLFNPNDQFHPSGFGSSVKSTVIANALSSIAKATTTPYPVSSTDTATWNGQTLVANIGPWSNTSTSLATGTASGPVANGFQVVGNASGAGVSSIVDRSSQSLGFWQQLSFTPSASGTANIYVKSDTLAAYGISVGDKIFVGMEVSITNQVAANCIGLQCTITAGDNSFSLSNVSALNYCPDSIVNTLYSVSPFTVSAVSAGQFGINLSASFAGSSTSALVMRVGRVFIRKA